MQLGALSAFILCNFHVYKWENAYKRLYMPKHFLFLMYIYLGEGRVWGITNACICMGTHSLSYRTD